MKDFKSIDYLKNILKAYPELEEWMAELQSLWVKSYTSVYVVWYMLAVLLLLGCITVYWLDQDIAEQFSYIDERQTVLAVQPNVGDRELHLSSERLFGQKIVSQGSVASLFKLQAILFATDPQQRVAMIQDATGVVKLYHQGEQLPGGVVVKTIQAQMIIIDSEGDEQVLKLNEYSNSFLSKQPLPEKNSIFDHGHF